MTDYPTTQQISPSAVEFCSDAAGIWRGDTAEPSRPGAEYDAFLKDLLEAEEKRNSGMETRALAVVTSSGTLVTLLLALAALVTRVQQALLPGLAFAGAATAAVLFVAAAACAGVANAPSRGWGLRPHCLRSELWERWGDASDNPVAKIAATRLKLWETTHKLTQRKAKLVFAAAVLQVTGALALTVAVISILGSRS
ncbi:hypothetical protein [Pseudonocardia charpentierae]|uniref:Integral membrane plasmid transfer protein n=1 Tax=Pseudonocardia charpentierae TaxID=3075545 RepID=A0ABU2NJI9_9PSEU|nr:hypothetical protein [Pseudonocardia sp. DSM 45834]MDT0353369.1 hypothetical protein [Pseudonocardia sp. DSM 45834]